MLKRHLAPETLERLLRNELLPERENDEAASKFKLGNLLRFGKGKSRMGTKFLTAGGSMWCSPSCWRFSSGSTSATTPTGGHRNPAECPGGIQWIGKLEERGLMISEGAEQTVNLQLSARGEVWSRLNQGDTTVVVDVPVLPSQGSRVWLLPHAHQFSRSITIIDSIDVRYTSPSTIDFTVSAGATRRSGSRNSLTAAWPKASNAVTSPSRRIPLPSAAREELVSQVDHAQVTISQEDMNSTQRRLAIPSSAPTASPSPPAWWRRKRRPCWLTLRWRR